MATTMTTAAEPAATTTYLDESPAYDFKELSTSDRKELIAEVRSISSSNTEATAVAAGDFTPSKTLLIGARGIRFVRIPTPSGQLEIPITNKASGELAYVSTRAKKCSGNAVLHDAEGRELLASEYFFGPGREPKIHLMGAEVEKSSTVEIKGKWTSRQQTFVLPTGMSFVWRYRKERDEFDSARAGGKEVRRKHLVLEVFESESPISEKGRKSKKSSEPSKRVAELVRNDEARMPGTGYTHAGNGGELQIDSAYCETIGLKEDVVVASCLMMLKKEIDRQRAVQAAILFGAIS